jgi:hypothetical protein
MKIKLLPGLVIALIICLIAVAPPAVTIQAAECFKPFIELSLKSAIPGTEVTVNGQRFDEIAYVEIYYDGTRVAIGRTDDTGDFTTTFYVPECYKGAHNLRVEVSDDIVETVFTVESGLTISPEKGPVGAAVTVTGQGFGENEAGIELMYYLNGSYETVAGNITANAKGNWKTSFPIPLSDKGEHRLDARSAETKFSDVQDATFKVTPGISIDKSTGIVGESITMTGSRFTANEKNITILFNEEAVVTDIEANSQGDWEESFQVPEMPAGEYNVTVESEQTQAGDISELSFEIESGIVLSPNAGYVGDDLTVMGQGFTADGGVVIKYDGRQVATAMTNNKGSFEIIFPVPESHHGECQVTAEDDEGNKTEQPATFTMESDAPSVPNLISPSDGSTVGLIGRVKPTFEWSPVSDYSGVYYSLQIMTGTNATSSSIIITVTGLTETSYTLQQPLNYGTYYWTVQAADGAENESGWAAARSLRAGLIPFWAFIAITTAIAAGIIALVRFLLIKRGVYR